MIRWLLEDLAVIVSLTLFLGMIAVWAAVLPSLLH